MKKILNFPFIYNGFQSVVGKFGLSQATLFAKYVPYSPGCKVLDLGCGPATCTHFFQPQDYLGLDNDNDYIVHARKKFPHYNFICGQFSDLACMKNPPKFDLIFAMGLLHHINNLTASQFLADAYNVIQPNGILVTFDGCIHGSQSRLRRNIVLADRGQYIRSQNDYMNLATNAGFTVDSWLEEKIYSIPHSMHVMACRK